MLKSKFLLPFSLLMTLVVAVVPVIMAQNDCPALVNQALNALGDNCGAMDRNTACYGYNLVGASFTGEVAENFFTVPSDRANVSEIETLTTAPLSVEDNRWGVAVMSLQANVPNTLPGQNVTFVLLGDVEVENAVPPEEAAAQVEPVTVTAQRIANIRSAGSLNANVIGAVSVGETLQADGLNETGEWLRVAYKDGIGFISRDLVTSDTDLSALPVISATAQTPMQAFYLRTGIGQVACSEAPADSLVIQSPQRLTVNFTVNGANVSLGSTAVIRILDGSVMEISVLEGKAVVEGVTVRQGYKTELCLGEPDDRGSDGESNDRVVTCAPSAPEFLDDAEQEAWCALGEIPATPLDYKIPIRCGGGIAFAVPTATPRPEKVFGAPETRPVNPTGGCEGLRPTSPLTDAPSSPTVFFWDGVLGATSYRVLFYSLSGGLIRTIDVPGTTPNVGVDGLAEGSQFQWAVEAYDGNRLLCVSLPTGVITVFGPQLPPITPVPPFGASWACGPVNGQVTVTWVNIGPTETVDIFFEDSYPFNGPYTGPGGPGPGSVIFNLFPFAGLLHNATVTRVLTGEVVVLPDLTCP